MSPGRRNGERFSCSCARSTSASSSSLVPGASSVGIPALHCGCSAHGGPCGRLLTGDVGELRGGRQPDDQVVPVKYVGGHAFGSALIDGMVGGLFGNGHVFLLKGWEGVTT